MKIPHLTGSMVALVTPMDHEGRLDFPALNRLIDWHVEQGSDCLVVAGTTGESSTLSHEEHIGVIGQAMTFVRGRIPIIAGTGSNSTLETIALSQAAHHLGVEACLQVSPYYNRPPQEGLYQHFLAVADKVPAQHILYNVPARTAVDILPKTVARLSAVDNIFAIKEASGQVSRIGMLQEALADCRPDFVIYSGDDGIALDVLKLGGLGNISVTANVAPRLMHQMCDLALNKDFAQAQAVNDKLASLNSALFVESNPIPVKWALHQLGLIQLGIRLPLVELDRQYHDRVRLALTQADCSSH